MKASGSMLILGVAAALGLSATQASAAWLTKEEGMYCISLVESLERANSAIRYSNEGSRNNSCGGTIRDPIRFGNCRYYEGRGDAGESIADGIANEYNRYCTNISMNPADLSAICNGAQFGSRNFSANQFCQGFNSSLTLDGSQPSVVSVKPLSVVEGDKPEFRFADDGGQ